MFVDIPWKNCDACAITVPASPQYCKRHGVYKIDKEVQYYSKVHKTRCTFMM